MSDLRVRVLATVFGVVAFAAVAAEKLYLQPVWFRTGDAIGTLGVLGLASAVAAPVLLFALLTRRLRRPRATFALRADGPAFVAAGAVRTAGVMAIAMMALAGTMVPVERVPDADRMQLAPYPEIRVAAAVVVVLLTGFAVAYCWLLRPAVTLTPSALTVGAGLQRRTVPWADLLPGGPAIPMSRWSAVTLLHRAAGPAPRRLNVPVQALRVDPAFLVSVVRHYAERPERRAAIGTQAELDRLTAAFAAHFPTRVDLAVGSVEAPQLQDRR